MDRRPVVTITVRHFILTSYDNNRRESKKTNTPEEIKQRLKEISEYK